MGSFRGSRRNFYTRFAISFCFLIVLAISGTATAQPRLIHVFVALADNEHQGIVPVPAAIGNGDDPERNLYWGAMYGLRTFFRKSRTWKEVSYKSDLNSFVLRRSIFVHTASGTIMVADAYRGREIRQAVSDFFRAAAGGEPKIEGLAKSNRRSNLPAKVSLAVYIGHDELMEPASLLFFTAKGRHQSQGPEQRDAIVLACSSKQFFSYFLKPTGARPLLWTTHLMAPEAYTLKGALDGWIVRESPEKIRARAAAAYAKYQKISLSVARKLFATGW
jgi:hypothetical protein